MSTFSGFHGTLLVAFAVVGCATPPELASVSLPPSVPAHTLFRDIAVFDGATLRTHQDVLITGSEIQAVADTGDIVVPPETLERAGTHLTLLPGLVDSHTHLVSAGEKRPPAPGPRVIGEAFLYAGVTTILVTAGFSEVITYSGQQHEGEVLGPKVYWGGPGLSAPEGHPIPLLRAMLPWPVNWFVTRSILTAADPGEAAARVRDVIAEHDPDFFKIIYDDLPPGSAHLSRDALRSAIKEATAAGLRTIVHTTTPEDTMTAVDTGAALLAHVPQRGVLSDEQVAHLVAERVPIVTTVRLVSASFELAANGPIGLEREMYDAALLQPWMADPRWSLEGFSEEFDLHHEQAAAETAANLQKLAAAGAILFVGTDSGVHGVFPGGSLHRELRLLVRLGMSPTDVLRAATSAPAQFLDPDGRFGRIAPGWRADLVVVRGDPTRDIDALAAIEDVFLGGVRLERNGL